MTKDEFIKIMLQMLRGHPALMRAKQASFQKTHDPIYMWQRAFRGIVDLLNNPLESHLFNGIVSFLSICLNDRPFIYGLSNKRNQTRCRKIRDMLDTNSPQPMAPFFDFNRDHNTGLLETLPSLHCRLIASNKSIVHLNLARQSLSARTDHRSAEFVKPNPSRLDTLQTHDSLQTCSAHASLLSAYSPHGSKPHPKRIPGTLHDGTCSQRSLMMTVRALYQIPLISPSTVVSATGTTKTVWPALNQKILSASFLGTESSFEFHQALWKIRDGYCLCIPPF
jgi:hypothetical protein